MPDFAANDSGFWLRRKVASEWSSLTRRSLRAHAALLDHPGPLRGFAVYVGLEVLGRLAADRDRATLAHARPNFGIGKHLCDRGVQHVDDRPRRASWHKHALPGRRHEVL